MPCRSHDRSVSVCAMSYLCWDGNSGSSVSQGHNGVISTCAALRLLCNLISPCIALIAGGATSVAAGRVSYTFGLKGPCVGVDTACSSSLVGMHYGARDIADDTCDRALAAGVNLTLNPGKTAAFTVTGEPSKSAAIL